jgi:hypothetical protein
MYCPKCSQEQLSDKVRFCVRCGFQLETVKDLLVQSNEPPAVKDESEVQIKFTSQRKQDLLVGATVIYIAAVATVLFSWVQPKGVIILPLSIIWVVFSLLVLFFEPVIHLARKFFSDNVQPSKTKLNSMDNAVSYTTEVNSRTTALPSTQSIPVAAFGLQQQLNTGEMIQPLSITESTTDLLDRK